MSIGEQIRDLRKKSGMTQEQLAEAIKVHRVTLAKYESGEVIPGANVLSRIAIALHVSQDILTGIKKDMSDGDKELWVLREQVRRDPERRYLFDLAKDGDISDIRQAVAIIDALKKTRK